MIDAVKETSAAPIHARPSGDGPQATDVDVHDAEEDEKQDEAAGATGFQGPPTFKVTQNGC